VSHKCLATEGGVVSQKVVDVSDRSSSCLDQHPLHGHQRQREISKTGNLDTGDAMQ